MIIIRRSLIATTLVAVSLISSQAVYAAVTHVPMPTHAMFATGKSVQFSVRNDSTTSVQLQAGDQVITVDAGKTLKVKVPVGTRITTLTATPKNEVGSFVVQVADSLSGATVAIS